MILTEEEARTKWCPEVRFIELSSGCLVDSRCMDTYPRAACIASGCMAWQWGDGGGYRGWQRPDGTTHWGTDSAKYAEGEQGQAAAGWLRVGYCGKGGKP